MKTPRKKSPFWKRMLIRLLVLLLIVIALLAVLPGFLLPSVGKSEAQRQLAAALGSDVQIEGIEGGWRSELRITGFRAQRAGEPEPWLSVKEVHVSDGLLGLGLGAAGMRSDALAVKIQSPRFVLSAPPKKGASAAETKPTPAGNPPAPASPPPAEPEPSGMVSPAVQLGEVLDQLVQVLQQVPDRPILLFVEGAEVALGGGETLAARVAAMVQPTSGLAVAVNLTDAKRPDAALRIRLGVDRAAGAPGSTAPAFVMALGLERWDLRQFAPVLKGAGLELEGLVDSARISIQGIGARGAEPPRLEARMDVRSKDGIRPIDAPGAENALTSLPLNFDLAASAEWLGTAIAHAEFKLEGPGVSLQANDPSGAPRAISAAHAAAVGAPAEAGPTRQALAALFAEAAELRKAPSGPLTLGLKLAVDDLTRWKSFLPPDLEITTPVRADGQAVLPRNLALQGDLAHTLRAVSGSELRASVPRIATAALNAPVEAIALDVAVRDGAVTLERLEANLDGGRLSATRARIDVANPAQSEPVTLSIAPPIPLRAIKTDALGVEGALAGAIRLLPSAAGWRAEVDLGIDRPMMADLALGVVPERIVLDVKADVDPKFERVTVERLALTERATGLDVRGDGLAATIKAPHSPVGDLRLTMAAGPLAAVVQRLTEQAWLDGSSAPMITVRARPGAEGEIAVALDASLPAVQLQSLGEDFQRFPASTLAIEAKLIGEAVAVGSLRFTGTGLSIQAAPATGQPNDLSARVEIAQALLDAAAPGMAQREGIALGTPVVLTATAPGFGSIDPAAMPPVQANFELLIEALALGTQRVDRLALRGEHAANVTRVRGEGRLLEGSIDFAANWPLSSAPAGSDAVLLNWRDLALVATSEAAAETPQRTTRARLGGRLAVRPGQEVDQLAVAGELSAKDLSQTLAGASAPAAVLEPISGRFGALATMKGDIANASMELQSADQGQSLALRLGALSKDAQRLSVRGLRVQAGPALVRFLMAGGEEAVAFHDPVVLTFDAESTPASAGSSEDPLTRLSGSGSLAVGRFTTQGLNGGPGEIPVRIGEGRMVLDQQGRIPIAGGALEIDQGGYVSLANPLDHDIKGRIANVAINEAMAPALSLAHPIFALGQGGNSKLSGRMNLNFNVNGKTGQTEWWQGVNGRLDLRLNEARVIGSSLLGSLGQNLDGTLASGALGPLQALLGGGEKASSPFAKFAAEGLNLQDFAMNLVIENGVVRSLQPVGIDIGEFRLTLGGTARLDGVVNFELGNDIVERLAAKAVRNRTGQNQNNPLGGIVGALTPLVGNTVNQALGIRVSGNALAEDQALQFQLGLTGSGRR